VPRQWPYIARVGPKSQTQKRALLTISNSIYHPTSGSPSAAGPATVLLLLPRGPLLSDAENDIANASYLQSRLPYTKLRNYYSLDFQVNPLPTLPRGTISTSTCIMVHPCHRIHHASHFGIVSPNCEPIELKSSSVLL
jgi:hypothetical protein